MFAKTRKFVDENRTYIAFVAGSVATLAVSLYVNKDVTLLSVPKSQLELLKQGTGSVVYELKDQTLTLVNVPAVQAAQAAL